METNRDSVFEDYLDEQLKVMNPDTAPDIATAARVAYYGAHYEQLFPTAQATQFERTQVTPGDHDNGRDRTLKPRMAIGAMAKGRQLCKNFAAKHPERILRYRTIIQGSQFYAGHSTSNSSYEAPNELPDDNWQLPLPNALQALVDSAPKTRAKLDEYFKNAVDRTWSDPAARAHAMAVYLDKLDSLSTTHLSEDVLRDLGFFAAEMRVLREKCRH